MRNPQSDTTDPKSVEAIIRRMKQAYGDIYMSDTNLTRRLGCSKSLTGNWKRDGTRPYRACIQVAEETGVSLDWLLLDRGPIRKPADGETKDSAAPFLGLEHARKLSDLSNAKNGIIPMDVWVYRTPILFGPDVGEFLREETKPAYWDYGSVEGTLDAIQDEAGGLELRIRDPLWKRAITCFFPEEMLGEAMRLFRQRVELFGEIRYGKDDTPESIRVNRLERLPDDDELPSIEEVQGLLSGGMAAG